MARWYVKGKLKLEYKFHEVLAKKEDWLFGEKIQNEKLITYDRTEEIYPSKFRNIIMQYKKIIFHPSTKNSPILPFELSKKNSLNSKNIIFLSNILLTFSRIFLDLPTF